MSDEISRDELRRAVSRSQNAEAFVFGLLLGAVVGGAIALLYAPAKGSDTRRALKEKAQQAQEALQDTIADLKDRAEELSTDIADTVADATNRGKDM